MTAIAIQVHCPFCNAAHAASTDGNYTCEFCLQPFSVVDAQREESRLLAEIKTWMEQRIGSGGAMGGTVDASSRGFIFRERILPALRRDVDRSLENYGSYGQFPLVQLPVRTQTQQHVAPNPLVAQRHSILGLKGLRARLENDEVRSFAVSATDQATIQSMDRRLGDLLLLSNVAEAAATALSTGYAAARKNLESLISEIDQSLAVEGTQDAGLGAYLVAIRSRYQALADLCGICEYLCDSTHIDAGQTGEGLHSVATQLAEAGAALEASNYSPADTMPTVIGINQESAACMLLARWVKAYGSLTRRTQVPFPGFVREMDQLCGGGHMRADVVADLVEACAHVAGAVHGDIATSRVGDFSWASTWAESNRQKKSFGMFGVEERLAGLEQFFLPVWAADVTYSAQQGAVFATGVEGHCTLLVDACAPDVARVVFIDQANHPLAQALGYQQALGTNCVALPRTTAATVLPVFQQALGARPQYRNPRVQVRGMAFLAATVATYETPNGPRHAATALNDALPVDVAVLTQRQAAAHLFDRFG